VITTSLAIHFLKKITKLKCRKIIVNVLLFFFNKVNLIIVNGLIFMSAIWENTNFNFL